MTLRGKWYRYDRPGGQVANVFADHEQVSNPNRRVEAVLADTFFRLGGRHVRHYRIKWMGCPTSQNTWETEDDLSMADVMLKDYRISTAVRRMRERTNYEMGTGIIDLTQDDD